MLLYYQGTTRVEDYKTQNMRIYEAHGLIGGKMNKSERTVEIALELQALSRNALTLLKINIIKKDLRKLVDYRLNCSQLLRN